MSKRIFETIRTECENKVKEILMANKCAVELEMTKNILLTNGKVVQPQTIFLMNDRVGIVDEYDVVHNINNSNAIFSILELLEEYADDMEEDIRIRLRIALG